MEGGARLRRRLVLDGTSQPDCNHARALIDTLLADAEREGAEMALLFPSADIGPDVESAFHGMPMTDLTLTVTESLRHGAPMTMVRGGEERDLAAIVAMGRVRADPSPASNRLAVITY